MKADQEVMKCVTGTTGIKPMHYLIKRPVAWRVADQIRGFHLFDDEDLANKHAQWVAPGFPVEGLYVRDGDALVSEWQSIETAPTGEDDFFLVCCDDPRDTRQPFVVRGSIFKTARMHMPTHHLSMAHLTHWMPLPVKPIRPGYF